VRLHTTQPFGGTQDEPSGSSGKGGQAVLGGLIYIQKALFSLLICAYFCKHGKF
jgi:hypothetical protein